MTAAPYRSIEEVGTGQVVRNVTTIMWKWWPSFVAVALVLRILIAVVNEFDASIWAAGVSISPVFLSVVGAVAGGLVMPRYIAQGVTRRHFAIGAIATIVGCALVAGIVIMAGFAVEDVMYRMAGIHHVLAEPTVYSSFPRALAVFASYVLLNAAYMCGGWTAGVGFYRWSWVGGFLYLPLAVLPVPLVEWLVGSDWAWNPTSIVGPVGVYLSLPEQIAGDIEIPVLVAVVISMLVVAAGLAVNRKITQNVTIN